ncbi:hypothetical protein E2C01_078396 [Portunus trituberculatus]|uniref:Uncharacterized protein n=1 Tax=Portunus trituberculatus TaxID=210409 RepID=A0A5B7IE72_PORTR|nr:hypothetical protein [Portunus trituberculatus]
MLGAHLPCLRLSRDPFCPWCMTTPEAMEHFLLQCPRFHSQHTALRILAITTLDLPTHPPGGLRCPPLLATCCPSPCLCLLEEDRPATTPVIPTQDYPRRGSWPVFLKKVQVRRRTAGYQERWTPEAAKRVGRSSVVMARVESQERSAVY